LKWGKKEVVHSNVERKSLGFKLKTGNIHDVRLTAQRGAHLYCQWWRPGRVNNLCIISSKLEVRKVWV